MGVFGFFNINKPLGLTSHDVVARVRRNLRIKKVGHAGTLDPLATGVLVVCVGAATRLSEYVMHTTKQYRAQMRLGVATTTYDAEGDVTAIQDASGVTERDLDHALADFVGAIAQQPPMYSAIKQGGRKLYELAREGQVVERPARPVQILHLAVVDWSPPEATLDVTCSSGTYIRSLAHDIGEALGVGAHLTGLTRTANGNFNIDDAIDLDTLLASANWQQYLIGPRTALNHLPHLHLDAAAVEDINQGRFVPDAAAQVDVVAQTYDPDGTFVAILKGDGCGWRPHKVFKKGIHT
jgi:tRNA pseudouridine55 synthase